MEIIGKLNSVRVILELKSLSIILKMVKRSELARECKQLRRQVSDRHGW